MSSTFDRRVAIVTDFLDGIGNLDFDRVAQHLARDAVMILPFLAEMAPVRGRSAIVDQLRNGVSRLFARMDFTYDEWYDVGASDIVIAEYRSVCTRRGVESVYGNSYITVFRFNGDEIGLYKEYLNPLGLTGLTA
jgi:ketosteroid isomerase-like protein